MRRGLPVERNLEDPYRLYEGVAYEQFWSGSQKSELDQVERALVRQMLPISGRRIIDVGCGYGRLADCYLDRFQQVVMVDGSMSLLRQAAERTEGLAVYIASDVHHLPFRSASFDAMLMIRVFHHIDDSQACLSELHRLLCGGGRFVFSYCNKQNPRRVARWMAGAQPENPFSTQPDGLGSTFVSHHPKAVHAMLGATGFSNMRYYGAGVMDRLGGRLGAARSWVGLARLLAPFFARARLAPWILCQAATQASASLIDGKDISDLLQCPACAGRLSDDHGGHLCPSCNRVYPVDDGIIDLRI